MSRKLLLPAVAILLGLAPAAFARQPEAASWKVLEAASEGTFQPGLTPGGDARVLISLFPSDDEFSRSHLLVVFPGCGEDAVTPNRPILNLEDVLRKPDTPAAHPEGWQDPGPRWRLCPSDPAFLLDGGQPMSFLVLVDFLRATAEGLTPRLNGEVHILSEEDLARLDRGKDVGSQWAAIVGRRSPAAHIVVDLYYRLDPQKGTFFYGGYADVFGKPGPDMIESAKFTNDYSKDEAELGVDLLSFRANLRIPRKTRDDGGRQFALTLARAQKAGSGLVGQKFCTREDYHVAAGAVPLEGEDDELDAAPLRSLGPRLGPLATYSLSGRFSTKWWADHSLHPGFGFRAEAWSDDSGSWHRLASDWVQSDGTWALTVSSGAFFAGNHLRMYYVTKNDYYDAQDISGNH